MKKLRKYILFLLIFLISCPSYSADTLSSEDYKVYSAVLEQMKPFIKKQFRELIDFDQILISDSTEIYHDEDVNFLKSIPTKTKVKSRKEAINDLMKKDTSLSLILLNMPKLSFSIGSFKFHSLLYSLELAPKGDGFYLEKFWDSFKIKYPKQSGIFSFSRVGYNSKTTKAILIFAYHCGMRCYESYLIDLKLTKKGWKITKKKLFGIS